ncbi:hypothetical protein PV797_15450 [Clostridiaceae bacterium M8S5]|nr:hypothetical protein PV797_15450 [Clostridiaceae bacterium M8S5]
MNKKVFIILIILLLILTGCNVRSTGGSFLLIKGDIDFEDNEITGKYSKFNGEKYGKYSFNEDDKLVFDITTETNKGKFAFYIVTDDHKCEIKDGVTFSVKKNTTYTFKVLGDNHSGSFSVKWKK